ncbi:MAG: CoA-binding protein [Beijerinckiaceae bacterium]
MNHDCYDDDYIRGILTGVKTIAVVGVSANPARPSNTVFGYMKRAGYRMFGVNPGLAGKELFGAPCYASLADIPEPVDMVDIFRASEAAAAVVGETLKLTPLPLAIWMQLTVRNDEAAAKAEAAGVKVVMNRCPKIEHGRLTGTIGFMGVNSGVMSSRTLKPLKG